MIIQLPPADDLIRISHLYETQGTAVAVRYMDRVLANMQRQGNAQVIPIRTKSRCTVHEWPTPPQPVA